jgi:hypothetical protein
MTMKNRTSLFGYFSGNKKNPWLVLLKETFSEGLRAVKTFFKFISFQVFVFEQKDLKATTGFLL